MSEIKPGMQFTVNGVLMEVVKPNEKLPGDWWCRAVVAETGLWSFDPRDIEREVKEKK